MRIPETPTPIEKAIQALTAERMPAILAPPLRPEVDGEYLHWDELRRRGPPPGLTTEDWWTRLAIARSAVATPLPLVDKGGTRLHFCRTAGVERLLHGVDRELGNQLETADPQITTPEIRDRYIVRSLAEEAITSSQLEGASATRKVAKEMLLTGREPRNRDELMIANNFRAMELVRTRKDARLTPSVILELHEVLTHGTLQDPADAGRLRRSDELIAITDSADGAVMHVPPDASELAERLEKLCAFANEELEDGFIHPVVRAITLHFMLAYDHPFVDGNGRTARALFYWAMLRERYWLAEFLSISRVIQKAPSQYARAFLFCETDYGDLTYFLIHQLGVLKTAIDDLYAYLRRKTREARDAEKLMRASLDLNQRQRLVIAHALRHPDYRYSIEAHAREYGVVYATARADLLDLAKMKLLTRTKVGRRFYFSVPANLNALLKGSPK